MPPKRDVLHPLYINILSLVMSYSLIYTYFQSFIEDGSTIGKGEQSSTSGMVQPTAPPIQDVLPDLPPPYEDIDQHERLVVSSE